MKAKYLVIISTDDEQYDFETVIERGDRISEEELIAALSPEADRYLESLGNEGAYGKRRQFRKLSYNFLGFVD
ncbi:hypothetical protein N8X72_01050 [Enterobacter hormaechei subsp. hoffmannii]|uniref:hypothetical protein n=1 Tax=Enterobacter hormaechei TaxID=158836 RepID=UPI0018EBCC1E|nr:hypothetical protein [Enterobacter hormaechei]MBJ6567631.1 hypothetical protein [Enterobacter hormaechei]MCU3020073.1 hypothetical protein [Enterobacter hormaechei subsp. hoffmannii]MCU4004925.1 hypothetical protein [Enterobacter hormaechei subsp. hoffmannii]